MFRLLDGVPRLSTAGALTVIFAGAYLALGPGCFFSVDEVVLEETAQAVYRRRTLEIPGMNTAVRGRVGAFYAHRGPAMGYVALPFVAVGSALDDRIGSFNGGTAVGPQRGTLDHPLRWGGRYSVFVALIANAVIGGLAVAMLHLIALRLGAADRVALAFACATGGATLLASESTHFFQHPLEAFALLCGFWFLSGRDRDTVVRDAWLGGLGLGLAILARPNAAPAAAVIWLYGAIVARTRVAAGDRRTWLLALAGSTAAPAAGAALLLLYNHLQFGSHLDFGYGDAAAVFSPSVGGPLRALAAYLLSPKLSVFLFAPLTVLIPVAVRQSFRRRPLETAFLVLAAAAHFAVIAFLPNWDCGLAYGPRYVLAPMLLLLPLTLPAFARAFAARSRCWPLALAFLIGAGAFVQLLGVSVDVTANQWYYHQHGIRQARDAVFIASASPVWVHLRDLLEGRNIIPWAWRAISHPGPELVLLGALILVIGAALRLLWTPRRPAGGAALPGVSLLVIGALIGLGFLATSAVEAPVEVRIAQRINAGLAAQQTGRDVEAAELYALVLSLDSRNTFALHNLAVLYEQAGKRAAAMTLYRRALAANPAFAPSAGNLTKLAEQEGSDSGVAQGCASARECYEAGKQSWDLGDRAAALSIWEDAAERFPAHVWLVRNVAWARYELGDYEGAVRAYRQAAALAPADTTIRTDLAWALVAASRFEEARQVCNEVLAHDRGNAAALAILARLPE
jgi:tetratricopeptide (TPR) repeat protein